MKHGVAALNAPLIGIAGGRSRIETPALLLDAEAFHANVDTLETCNQTFVIGD